MKTTLECCSYQWSDFDDQAEQLAKWIDDQRIKIEDIASEKCDDLIAKKATLKKAKVRNVGPPREWIEEEKNKAHKANDASL